MPKANTTKQNMHSAATNWDNYNKQKKVSHTSALYIFTRPLLTFVHIGTLLIPHNVFECSKNGPVLTCD